MSIRGGLRDDRGAVVAEFAVVLPAIALVLLLAAGTLGATARHVRLQDAAADAARILARGESAGRAGDLVASAVPGAAMSVEEDADLVCVTATANAILPVTLTATSCALAGGR